ncbi:MAG: hypothetical protein AAF460_17420 [Pseudomonadota bacterium]
MTPPPAQRCPTLRLLSACALSLSLLVACATPTKTETEGPAPPTAIYESAVTADTVAINPLYRLTPQTRAVQDNNTVLFETIKLHAWLDRNRDTLPDVPAERRARMRERVYALIDSRAKYITAQEGQWVLPSRDPVLSILFYWVDALNVYGGALLVDALEPTPYAPPTTHTRTQLPDHLDLQLEHGLFHLRSRDDWSVRYPYSFMLWQIGTTEDAAGQPVEVAIISTATAEDSSEYGHSQATILLSHYPSNETDALAHALPLYGMGGNTAPEPTSVGGFNSLYAFDAAQSLHKEVVSVPLANGTLVLLYTGLEGTYQWNRLHFADFLQALSIGPG